MGRVSLATLIHTSRKALLLGVSAGRVSMNTGRRVKKGRPVPGRRKGVNYCWMSLDLTYEVKSGSQSVSTESPVGWANLVPVLVYKYGCSQLAQGFCGATSDA
jgi:hypothetical protein